MSQRPTLRRSRYRIVLNVCAIIWFVTCALMLLAAFVMGVIGAIGVIRPGAADPHESWQLIAWSVVSALVDLAILYYGRRYFRYAYGRIAELERWERRGPK